MQESIMFIKFIRNFNSLLFRKDVSPGILPFL
jgi:hypothetical protein